ncbi:ABC transporter permease [Marinicrinis sediminis]|uniref:ABC transporter permease n=1 Tax=Marinicrinis sediminis TaxID=1652465 RepID=A0ABW5R7U3_9BACL
MNPTPKLFILTMLHAEWIKQKRNGIWWLVLLLPLGTTLAMGLDMVLRYADYLHPQWAKTGGTSWELLLAENHGVLGWGLFLPLFIAVLSTFIHHVELKQPMWKQLLAMPIPKVCHYAAKYTTVMLFSLILIILNSAGLILIGWLMDFPEPFPLQLFLQYILFQWVAIWGVAAIQNMLNILMRNPVLPVCAALAGMVASGMLLFHPSPMVAAFPYVQAFIAGDMSKIDPSYAVYGGIMSSILFQAIGLYGFLRKE